MFKQRKTGWLVLLTVLIAVGITVGSALARETGVPRHNPLAVAQDATAQLVILMDQDEAGTVSKADFLKFMAAEFDRLDTNRTGVLNVDQLRQAEQRNGQMRTFAKAGK